MSLTPCPELNCPELVRTGRCAAHTREVEGSYRHRGERKQYRTKRWRALSRHVLAEEPLCDCGCGGLTVEVDHIVPVEDGGGMWDRSNLKARCHVSHSRKTRTDVATRTYT